MSLWPTICWGSSCGGLPSAGTIQPRCCPHGCFLRVITASPPFPVTRARSAPSLRPPRQPARRCCTHLRCCCCVAHDILDNKVCVAGCIHPRYKSVSHITEL